MRWGLVYIAGLDDVVEMKASQRRIILSCFVLFLGGGGEGHGREGVSV